MMVTLLLVLLWCSGGGVVGEERRRGAQENYSRFLNHGWRSRQVNTGLHLASMKGHV